MDEKILVWFSDIEIAIDEMYDFLPEPRIFADFQKDLKTRRAIERNIEIIGEAMIRVLMARPDTSINESRKIVDTRNRIIHGYDSVSPDILWLIVVKYLPILKVEIEKIKNSLNQN